MDDVAQATAEFLRFFAAWGPKKGRISGHIVTRGSQIFLAATILAKSRPPRTALLATQLDPLMPARAHAVEVIAARLGALVVEVHADQSPAATACAAGALVRERREVGLLDGRGHHARTLPRNRGRRGRRGRSMLAASQEYTAPSPSPTLRRVARTTPPCRWSQTPSAAQRRAPDGRRSRCSRARRFVCTSTTRAAARARRGALISRDRAVMKAFSFSRRLRDRWLAWPARVGPQLAAQFELDASAVTVVLEGYVREHLTELASERCEFWVPS